jgi:hypothetical protein
VSGPFLFDRMGRSLGPTCHPCSRWPCSLSGERSMSVAVGHRRPMWVGPPYRCFGRHRGHCRPLRSSLPPFTSPPRYSALRRPPLHPSSLATDESPPSCPTGPKEAPRHHAPPTPRVCPLHRLAKPGHGISQSSSSSMSTSLATAFSDCSCTSSTPQ